MSKVSIVIVGVGGYGAGYFTEITKNPDCGMVIKGVVDPMAKASRVYEELKDSGIPVFDTIGEFFQNNTAEMAAIITPIHLHYRHAMECISHGAHVLLEKPVCAASSDARKLLAAQEEYGRFIAVGYQLSFSDDVLSIKRDILDGKFGKPLKLAMLCANQRGSKYYSRNGWAGKIATGAGEPINDSPVHNANAHYLHLMLFLLGNELDTACAPTAIDAELYRANKNIENFDTVAMKCEMPGGAEVYYYTTHATSELKGPQARLEFEKGTIYCGGEHGRGYSAVMRDGEAVSYTKETGGGDFLKKVRECASSVRSGNLPTCTVKTALPQLLVVEALQSIYDEKCYIDEQYLTYNEADGQRFCYIKGIEQTFATCFAQNILPKQSGAEWARDSRRVIINQ